MVKPSILLVCTVTKGLPLVACVVTSRPFVSISPLLAPLRDMPPGTFWTISMLVCCVGIFSSVVFCGSISIGYVQGLAPTPPPL
jgi:hypothetical protein